MGLDMYLNARRYLFTFDEASKALAENIRKLLDVKQEVEQVELQAAYWRKANHIHAWFVANVQDGKDECEEHNVSREKLITLRDLCQQVLDNPDKASELLPTQGGFFFGSTEYDNGYFDDLRNTIRQLDEALALAGADSSLEGWSFTYQSSW